MSLSVSIATLVSLTGIALALVLGVLAIRARRRGQISLGLRPDVRTPRHLGGGLLLGSIAISAILGTSILLGVTHLYAPHPNAETIVGGILVLVVLAAYEELLFRVFLLSGLQVTTRSPRWALLISVVVTVANHAFTDGVTTPSLVSAGLGGLMYSLAYLGSGRWWLPLGLHLAWNIVQGPIYGYPVSGTLIGDGPLINQHTSGPDWITGGAYGPEAGLVAIAVRLIVIAVIIVTCRDRLEEFAFSSGRSRRSALRDP